MSFLEEHLAQFAVCFNKKAIVGCRFRFSGSSSFNSFFNFIDRNNKSFQGKWFQQIITGSQVKSSNGVFLVGCSKDHLRRIFHQRQRR